MIEAGAPDFWLLSSLPCAGWKPFRSELSSTSAPAFLVSMMTMLRLLPMGLFGFFLGALAERLIADERSSSSCF
jgi:hypothetical protein